MSFCPKHQKGIVINVETKALSDLVGRNEVQVLCDEFLSRMGFKVLCFGCKTHREGALGKGGHFSEDVWGPVKAQSHFRGRFLEFLRRDFRGIVCNRCGAITRPLYLARWHS